MQEFCPVGHSHIKRWCQVGAVSVLLMVGLNPWLWCRLNCPTCRNWKWTVEVGNGPLVIELFLSDRKCSAGTGSGPSDQKWVIGILCLQGCLQRCLQRCLHGCPRCPQFQKRDCPVVQLVQFQSQRSISSLMTYFLYWWHTCGLSSTLSRMS
jgi:hypothetical protein